MVSIHLHTEIPPNRALFTGLQCTVSSKHFVKKTPANLLFEGWTLLFVTESDQLDVPENHLAEDILGDPCVEAADSTTDEDALQYKLGGVTDPFFD